MRTAEFGEFHFPFVGRRNSLLALTLGFSNLVACETGGGLRSPRGTSEATGGNLGSFAVGGTGGASGFPAVSVGGRYTDHCVLNADQTISCLPEDSQVSPPRGTFTSLSVGGFLEGCGVRADGTLACWGNTGTPPTGTFKSVSVGLGGSSPCAVRTNGTIVCWSESSTNPFAPPPGTFTSVSVGGSFACGVKTDGTVACWRGSRINPPEAIAGTFTSFSVGDPAMCGIRSDGTVACAMVGSSGCTDNGADCLIIKPPAGTFTAVSVGRNLACGIKIDGTLACWPDWFSEIPTGTFTSVSVGGDGGACGVRTDGNVVCWSCPHR